MGNRYNHNGKQLSRFCKIHASYNARKFYKKHCQEDQQGMISQDVKRWDNKEEELSINNR
eukprot:12133217-Ditylum_brightwellii.AAC.1